MFQVFPMDGFRKQKAKFKIEEIRHAHNLNLFSVVNAQSCALEMWFCMSPT